MNESRCRKGQTFSIEAVLLFAIGIGLFTTFFIVFGNYQRFFEATSTADQLALVQQHITANILKAAASDSDVDLLITIPQRIANEPYEVSLSAAGLAITTLATNTTVTSDLYNITNSFTLESSTVSSVNRQMRIYRTGTNIILLN